MKLEYLADGSPDCPLVRLYDFDSIEARLFLDAVAELASGTVERVEVHGLPFVEPLDGCRLTSVRRTHFQALSQVGPATFECAFTADV